MMVISVKDRVVGADYAKWAKNVNLFSTSLIGIGSVFSKPYSPRGVVRGFPDCRLGFIGRLIQKMVSS